MKVQNMLSNAGNKIANQFVIEQYKQHKHCTVFERVFQSYNSIIARVTTDPCGPNFVELDKNYWNYSVTTGKYRNQFLNENKKETQKKINSGEYIRVDLN